MKYWKIPPFEVLCPLHLEPTGCFAKGQADTRIIRPDLDDVFPPALVWIVKLIYGINLITTIINPDMSTKWTLSLLFCPADNIRRLPMKILKAFGKSLVVVIIPILIGLLGNIISPDLVEKLKTTYPNYLIGLTGSFIILAIIIFTWGMREELTKGKSKNNQEGSIQLSQRGKNINESAKVTGIRTNGQIPSGRVEQDFDKVEGELTGINVSSDHQDS